MIELDSITYLHHTVHTAWSLLAHLHLHRHLPLQIAPLRNNVHLASPSNSNSAYTSVNGLTEVRTAVGSLAPLLAHCAVARELGSNPSLIGNGPG